MRSGRTAPFLVRRPVTVMPGRAVNGPWPLPERNRLQSATARVHLCCRCVARDGSDNGLRAKTSNLFKKLIH